MTEYKEGFIEDILNEIMPILTKHQIVLMPFLNFIKNDRGTYSLLSLEKMACLLMCPLEYIIDLNVDRINTCAQSASIFIKTLGLDNAYALGKIMVNLNFLDDMINKTGV